MKKIITTLMITVAPFFVLANEDRILELQNNGFEWYGAGQVIYSGAIPLAVKICTLDEKSLITNSAGETAMLNDNSCIVTSDTELSTSHALGGVMVKILY